MQIEIGYKKIGALVVFTLLMVAGYSQNTINNYKYVIVPKKFDFLSSADEYDLNTVTKYLLEAKGFTVFYNNDNLPPALVSNRCSALTAEITQRKALFSTNLTLTLKDCFGNTIYKGKEGRSWEKEFPVAYNEALKNAFTTLNALPYKYDSTQAAQPQQATASTQLPAAAPGTQTAPATALVQPTPPIPAPAPGSPAPTPVIPAPTPATGTAPAAAGATLYAQPTSNGYQLIDTTPKKVMTLLKTSMQDCYLTDNGAGAPNGMVFKKDGEWLFEYYKEGTLISQKLTIKF